MDYWKLRLCKMQESNRPGYLGGYRTVSRLETYSSGQLIRFSEVKFRNYPERLRFFFVSR